MTNVTVKLDATLRDWLRAEAAGRQMNISAAIRFWLRLAYKYRHAIAEAEAAPVRFVRQGNQR